MTLFGLDIGDHFNNDDYAFRGADTPTGSVEITVDFYWDGKGSAGALAAVQDAYPHQYYEAALYQGCLVFAYLAGSKSTEMTELARAVTSPGISHGFYRIVYRAILDNHNWALSATLLDAENAYAVITQVNTAHDALGPGRQGISIWNGVGGAGSYITEISVMPS